MSVLTIERLCGRANELAGRTGTCPVFTRELATPFVYPICPCNLDRDVPGEGSVQQKEKEVVLKKAALVGRDRFGGKGNIVNLSRLENLDPFLAFV